LVNNSTSGSLKNAACHDFLECAVAKLSRTISLRQKLASALFKGRLDQISAGAIADLVVVDYQSPTPLTSQNFAWHFIFGISAALVSSVMVNGKFLLRDGKYQTIDPQQAAEKARQAANKLWMKMEKI